MSATVLACQGEPNEGEGGEAPPRALDDREVVHSAVSPPPISGGTLLVMDGGETAVAADPDRDLVHVIDLLAGREAHVIELREGDEPGRLVADAEGRVHVVARRGGVVVDLDPEAGTILERREVCANPRGIAYDEELDQLHIACAGGDLVSVPASGGSVSRRVHLAPDLRDVVRLDEGLMVTRFRSAQMLFLDDEGAIVRTEAPPSLWGNVQLTGESLHPNTAWRTVATPDGDWLMLHQVSTDRPLGAADDLGLEHGPGDGYGGQPDRECDAVVNSMLTLGEADYVTRGSALLQRAVLPVDVAISQSGGRVAVAVAGLDEDERGGVVWLDPGGFDVTVDAKCRHPGLAFAGMGQYTAVAFDPQGRILAQSREPAALAVIDPWTNEVVETIGLAGEPRHDTGHELFHTDAGRGIACASCHAEGGDDGRRWQISHTVVRHTPALSVGLEGTEPFHWQGDLPDMAALVDEVHVGRMGGRPLADPRIDALQSWMFSIPIPHPRRSSEDAAALRGAALFAQWDCGSCHRGAALDGGLENVSIGFDYGLQVPGLRGVAMHPPYMHDGRSEDLSAAVVDMLARTRPGLAPTVEQLSDMVAYLETL